MSWRTSPAGSGLGQLQLAGRRRVADFGVTDMVDAYTELFIEQAMARRANVTPAGELQLAEA